jgi:hypothetical protein
VLETPDGRERSGDETSETGERHITAERDVTGERAAPAGGEESGQPIGRVNLRMGPAGNGPLAAAPPSTQGGWSIMAVGIGIIAVLIMIAALFFVLHWAYEPPTA